MNAAECVLTPYSVVVALFADNDFGDLLRNKIFRVDERDGLGENGSRIADDLQEEFRSAASPLALHRLVSRTPTLRFRARPVDSVAAVVREEARVESWLDECAFEYENTVVDADPRVLTLLGDHYDADIALLPETESARYKVRLMELVMKEMRRLCDSHGAALAFLIVPSPIDACDDWDVGRVNGELYPAYAPSNLTDTLRKIAERSDLSHLDLFPPFAEHGPRKLYFRHGNNHWNDAGQDLAARLLSAYVHGEALLR